jgi:alkylation response protein AidB-like acyl-CoA dehydrogenase
VDAVLDASERLARERFANHHRLGDVEEPRIVDGRVVLPAATGEAIAAYRDAGFCALAADAEAGGPGLPYSAVLLSDAHFLAANVSTAGYILLARGVANLLGAHGSASQQRRYRQPLLDGRFLGTMCLSEPQAGSSLADITTRADALGDGTFRITGQKMWISGGDHELAENIVHMVLARIPGAPPGVRGISLFVVPKFRVDDDGAIGAPNDVRLAGLNHKLGQRGIVNTFLKFGEAGDCIGELVGAPHQGLAQMFHLMNEARIGVGMGAVMQGMAGYAYSLRYARERRQGRHPDQKDPSAPPVPIVEHADVRRMLLRQKCLVEGGLALALYAARQVDLQAAHPDAGERERARLRLDLLTPVVKAWPARWCTEANDLAIQVLGGYGYTREFPVEQFWRDNRLNPIHEGSNGIQALDLLGRKAMQDDGAALRAMLDAVRDTIDEARGAPGLSGHAEALAAAVASIERATAIARAALAGGGARRALANATSYLDLVGHVLVAWTWLRQAQVAQAALTAGDDGDATLHRGKLAACEVFFRHELPRVAHDAHLLATLDDSVLRAAPDDL